MARIRRRRTGYYWVRVRGRGLRCKAPTGRFAPSYMCGRARRPRRYAEYTEYDDYGYDE